MSKLLKGKAVADALDTKTIEKVRILKEKNIQPCVAILRVGQKTDDLSYERSVSKKCEKLGISLKQVVLSEKVSQEELLRTIDELNKDDSVHGILMFRPLPKSLDEIQACTRLVGKKDIDGITLSSLAKVYSNSGEGFAPCTAQAVIELLHYYNIEIKGKNVVVIGRSLVIGKPVAMLLLQENGTVTICHSKTNDMKDIVSKADIIVSAIGKAESLTADYFGEGQVVIDVGINYSDSKNKLVGDVCFEEVSEKVAAITPVPGGIGSITVSVLLSHVVEATINEIS